MSSPDSGDNDGPGLVELTSNIGTWVAAGLAIVALVGIVGPLLALQASASDKNRAMNAVHDQQQKYVSRGFHLTRGLRVFRRIRVPNLSPGYITNEPDTAPLVPSLRGALGRWVLKPRNYLPWNSGWAKFSELIEAYEVRDGTSNGLVDLCVPKAGGSLEIVNSRTALVVNKHWILMLGLLGRYGDRVDKGILQRTGIRRDMQGERGPITHFGLLKKDARDTDQELEAIIEQEKEHDQLFEWVAKRSRRALSNATTYDSGPKYKDTVWAVRRSAYGTITLEETPQPTIYGITGTMQGLGRHKGSWSYLTSISFVPHTAREIFRPGSSERRETSSLQTLFWLAYGFLPCGRTPEGRQRVISLESPTPEFEAFDHSVDLMDDWPAYSLQESDDIPVSIGTALQCMGIPEPKVLQFLPVTITGRAGSDGASRSITKDDDESSFFSRSNCLRVRGAWVSYARPSQGRFCTFQRDDLEKALRLVLTLGWDDWGFLVWKDQLWISILKASTEILNIELNNTAFLRSSGLTPHARVFRWQHHEAFHPRKLADQLALDKYLTAYFEELEILPLHLALGTLYILDTSLRELTERAYERLCKLDEQGNEPGVEELKEKVSELVKKLEEIEQSYWNATELHATGMHSQPSSSPLVEDSNEELEESLRYTTYAMRHLDPETLDKFGIDYMPGEFSSRPHILVKRLVPEWEHDVLLVHTRIIRELAEANRRLRKQLVGVLKYEYGTKQLQWYFDRSALTESRSWQLRPRDLVMTNGIKSTWIEEKVMVMVGLWVANRASIWIGAQDSRPLLKFVEELDTYAYVL